MSKTILVGDFCGIQNYLYCIQKNKTATKRLKGRSMFIEIMLEVIKHKLIEKLGEADEYITSGGKFILIFYQFDENKFEEFKAEFEKKLFEKFYGELQIVFGLSDWDGADETFKNALNKAFYDAENGKRKLFETVLMKDDKWNEVSFVFEGDRGPDKVCKFSRDRLVDEEMSKVFVQDYFKNDKEKLSEFFGTEDESEWKLSKEAINDIFITEYLRSGEDFGINIIDYGFKSERLGGNNEKLLDGRKFFPLIDDRIKTFEKMVEGRSFKKLACLKGDIDSLGETFQFNLKEDNYKDNYQKLSEILDNFWKGILYELIGDKDIYVVYAGGDDFMMIGAWDVIIEFYKELLREFEEYIEDSNVKDLLKENKLIHFSGAINLFGAHDIFFAVAKQIDELLDEAKDSGSEKNKVNVFGKVVKNQEFKQIFKEAKEFRKKYKLGKNESVVSVGTLRFLLNIANKMIVEDNGGKDENKENVEYLEYGIWRAELYYHLHRNYKTKDGNKDQDVFRKYMDGMLLKQELSGFNSQSDGNDNLFNESKGKKLYIMIYLLLYQLR